MYTDIKFSDEQKRLLIGVQNARLKPAIPTSPVVKSLWGRLPEEVSVHYNAAGVVNCWGSKRELLLLPGIGVFLLLFLQILEKYPEFHTYPQRLNESNAAQFFVHSRNMINSMLIIGMMNFDKIYDYFAGNEEGVQPS
ncbi:hypothetical protein CN899_25375 [Bacillus thuringiensis]|uniref:DUF1648 domain-containing protein n=1 Tax=Bacillus thuringiensis TaxID=1428 RepID=A0A9X7GGX2_BACTU|nr:hypothetical protein CN899_25375 [Bacillus thuringiensis]